MTCRIEDGVTYKQAYNAENRLATVRKLNSGDCANPGLIDTQWDFTYDGDGTRVHQTVTAWNQDNPQTIASIGITAYFLSGAYEVRTDGNNTVTWTIKYYAMAGMTVAMNDGNGLQYLLTDHLGSVVAITDNNGSLVSQQRYLPFGEVRTDAGTSITQTDYGFTGQHNMDAQGNASLGLMDYRARMYDTYLNRWIQPDSTVLQLLNPQSLNRYSYVSDNPIKYTDPSGHKQCAMTIDGECDKQEELGNYAYDILEKYGKKDDLGAMVRIVKRAAHIYRTYDKMMPALSEIFLGVKESNPFTIWNATKADSCAGVGRDPVDCAPNAKNGAFGDTGFNKDYRDFHNQIYHYWAYVTTTASTDYPVGGYAAGWFVGNAANVAHELFGVGEKDPQKRGASWQDYALAQEGMNTGTMIAMGAISPGELGDYINENVGKNGSPYVNLFEQLIPLPGNR